MESKPRENADGLDDEPGTQGSWKFIIARSNVGSRVREGNAWDRGLGDTSRGTASL